MTLWHILGMVCCAFSRLEAYLLHMKFYEVTGDYQVVSKPQILGTTHHVVKVAVKFRTHFAETTAISNRPQWCQ